MDDVKTLQGKVHDLLAEAFALLKGDGNPPTRESSLTKTKLEEAIMWNNKDRAMRGEMKDLFNKKAIEEVKEKLARLDTEKMDRSYREAVEALVDDLRKDIQSLAGIVAALEEHFGLYHEKAWEDDPSYFEPKPKQREVWKILRREK